MPNPTCFYILSQSLVVVTHWLFSHYRRIICLRRVICWIIRIRQIIGLNLKMERFSFWMNNPPDFIHLFIRQFWHTLKMGYPSLV